jgi:hypothetical protein
VQLSTNERSDASVVDVVLRVFSAALRATGMGVMAIFHVQIKSVSRGAGRSSVGAAAYISRDRLRDMQTGRTYDYRSRGGLEHKEILLPANATTRGLEWARSSATLWNAAERAETRANARVGREYVFSLPHELTAERRIALAGRLAQDIADRYGGVVDFAVHRAPADGDPRNYHVHVLSTTRELTATGLGRKTPIELSGTERYERGLPRIREEFKLIRERAAGLTNTALREAGLEIRVDHRSYKAQGLDRVPLPRKSHGAILGERRTAKLHGIALLGDDTRTLGVGPATPTPQQPNVAAAAARRSGALDIVTDKAARELITPEALRLRARANWLLHFHGREPPAPKKAELRQVAEQEFPSLRRELTPPGASSLHTVFPEVEEPKPRQERKLAIKRTFELDSDFSF